jgi:hypothetical protein
LLKEHVRREFPERSAAMAATAALAERHHP